MKTLKYFVRVVGPDTDRSRYPVSSVPLNDKLISMDGLYDLLDIDDGLAECFEAVVQETLENVVDEAVREFHWEHNTGVTVFWWVTTVGSTEPKLLEVTHQTQLLDLPKEILLPLDPTPVDEIANCTVGQYLQTMEGTGVVPAGSISFLRSVLEDFDNLGELTWRPE